MIKSTHNWFRWSIVFVLLLIMASIAYALGTVNPVGEMIASPKD